MMLSIFAKLHIQEKQPNILKNNLQRVTEGGTKGIKLLKTAVCFPKMGSFTWCARGRAPQRGEVFDFCTILHKKRVLGVKATKPVQ